MKRNDEEDHHENDFLCCFFNLFASLQMQCLFGSDSHLSRVQFVSDLSSFTVNDLDPPIVWNLSLTNCTINFIVYQTTCLIVLKWIRRSSIAIKKSSQQRVRISLYLLCVSIVIFILHTKNTTHCGNNRKAHRKWLRLQ